MATAAATDPIRMSRCFTCISSWASTPSHLVAGQRLASMPWVHAHHGVVGVAAGGEGVGLLGRADGDAWHRQVGALGQAAHHGEELGSLGLVDDRPPGRLAGPACR